MTGKTVMLPRRLHTDGCRMTRANQWKRKRMWGAEEALREEEMVRMLHRGAFSELENEIRTVPDGEPSGRVRF